MKKSSIEKKIRKKLKQQWPNTSMYISNIRRKRGKRNAYTIFFAQSRRGSDWWGYEHNYEVTL